MEKQAKISLITALVLLFLLILIFFISPIESILITVFNNSLSNENLTFTGNQNITRYLSIPRYSNITSAYMNLSGYRNQTSTSRGTIETETSTSSQGSFHASYPVTNAYDEDYNTAASPAGSSYANITIINTIDNSLGNLTNIDLTYKYAVLVGSGSYLRVLVWNYTLGGYSQLAEHTGGSTPGQTATINLGSDFIQTSATLDINRKYVMWLDVGYNYIYEDNIVPYENGNIFSTNVSLTIGNTNSWNFTGTFNQTNNRTSNLASTISNYLNSTYLVGTNYLIPFIFHSDTAGILQYSDIQIDYDPIPLVYLISPSNATYSSFNKTFICNSTDEIQLSNITLYIWNSTSLYNNSNIINISGTSNSTTFNAINFSRSDNYTWNCLVYNNGSYSNWYEYNYTLFVDTTIPVTTLNYPTNNAWLNTGTNVNFNCTTEGENLDSQFFYGNFTGTWTLNQTTSGITSGNINTYLLNLSDGSYLWTCGANKSTDSTIVYSQYGNYTLTIDTTYPIVNITSITGSAGSPSISVNYVYTEIHPNNCYYSIFDSTGGIDGISNNISIASCVLAFSASITTIPATYNMTVYVKDKATNTNSSTYTFTVTSAGVTPGGGGGEEPEIIEVPSNKTFCGDNFNKTGFTESGLPACQNPSTGFPTGNDNSEIEDFFNCPTDCPPANIENAIWGCLDNDPSTDCIWSSTSYKYIALSFGVILFTLALSKVEDKSGKQVPAYQYVYASYKRRRRRRR